ncbi:MAG: ATP-binding protein [Akkermansia sp.]|nr:ATP-binding protein [Akkermansia sp.]
MGADYMEQREYIPRKALSTVAEMTRSFPCVMVTGARQVGKSTMLKQIMPPSMRYISLDDFRLLKRAKEDPIGFLDEMGTPLCIDEVQYAPDLLRAIKLKIDEADTPGMYWLTGSQRFHMMKNATESLAGRVGIVELCTLSQQEAARETNTPAFFPSAERLRELTPDRRSCDINELYTRIWRGGYPALHRDLNRNINHYFDSYLQTYLERDVQALTQVGDKNAFLTLMQSAAARTGQQLVYSDLAQDAGISPKTAKSWISILEAGGIITLLQPYHTNTIKRLSKTPKLYFMDTGLCAWLCNWPTPATLQGGAMSGAILETWVFGQLYRALGNRGMRSRLSYYRDSNGAEIDFLLETEGKIYPMEVKRNSNPTAADLKALNGLPTGNATLQPGVVLCTAREMLGIGKGHYAFPISAM